MTSPSNVRAAPEASDTRRRQNLSAVLKLVHRSNGLSRSVLTSRTGLNRSTIAALVGELVEQGLVIESGPENISRVGRPSPMVRPQLRGLTVAVNPEIDAITVALVGLGGHILDRRRRDLPGIPSPAEAVAVTAQLLADLLSKAPENSRIIGMGVAVPGLVQFDEGIVRLAPHLAWIDVPFAAMLAEATGLRVVAGNDARLGCLAESAFGAGRDVDDFVYLNGGASGIGGGIYANGSPLAGLDGFAGEFGHTLVQSDGVDCHCGATGCLETEVRREPLLRLVGLNDTRSDELLQMLAKATDPRVTTEIRRQLDYLAIAIRGAIHVLNPRLIILGGFLGDLYSADAKYLEDRVTRWSLAAPRHNVLIERAQLGADILLIGAAELAFEETLADPASFGRTESGGSRDPGCAGG